jgi:hypothetical protein
MLNKKTLWLLASLVSTSLLTFTCVPLDQSSSAPVDGKDTRYEDYIYEYDIKTVRLYPFSGSNQDMLKPAIQHLSQPFPFLLEFDELSADFDNYNVKIIHCDANWKKSRLSDMEFLSDYNEFLITDYTLSVNTRPAYSHYRVKLPRVKVSGNYVAKVYRGNNENDVILTKRFMIFEDLVLIQAEVNPSNVVANRRNNQQIDMVINYSNVESLNPTEEFKVVIRQNHRWDNAIAHIRPTMVREHQRTLEFRHFDAQNNFQGGNEFRFFDIRTLNFLGAGVSNIEIVNDRIHAMLMKDRSRKSEAYSQINDLNGSYIIANLETGNNGLESNYMNTHFFLQSQQLDEDVYILGELTNWRLDNESRMEYDHELGGYTKSMILKQGIYDYIYYVKNAKNPYQLEGSHFDTENFYDILVYYRPIGARADRIAGYTHMNHHERNQRRIR